MPDERAQLKSRLADLVAELGQPRRFGELIADSLGTPKAMDRMIRYLYGVRPSSAEEIADEMLAIREEHENWRRKKAAEYSNMKINELLYGDLFGQEEEED